MTWECPCCERKFPDSEAEDPLHGGCIVCNGTSRPFEVEHDPGTDRPVKLQLNDRFTLATQWMDYETAAELAMALWGPIDQAAKEGDLPEDLLEP